MHPDDDPLHAPRLRFSRNRSCFLLGASWSHDRSWAFRVTHFYLGFWVLTLTTASKETEA